MKKRKKEKDRKDEKSSHNTNPTKLQEFNSEWALFKHKMTGTIMTERGRG
jgi:hypothetical protein